MIVGLVFVPATIQKRRPSPHGKLLRHNDSLTTAGLQVMYLLTTVGLQVMYLLCHNDSLTTVGLQVMLDSDCRAGVRSCNHSKTTALPPLRQVVLKNFRWRGCHNVGCMKHSFKAESTTWDLNRRGTLEAATNVEKTFGPVASGSNFYVSLQKHGGEMRLSESPCR